MAQSTATRLPTETAPGSAHLLVTDLQRALRFYTDVLGFTLSAQSDETALLTAGGDSAALLRLSVLPNGRPKPPHTTGLYHVAILVPSRLDLARTLRRLVEMEYPLQGASDHLVSEALYLADPDGNGLEIYRDRPRTDWRYAPDGQVAMDTLRLDLRALLEEGLADSRPWSGMAPGTRIGHVHLQIADLDAAVAFYQDVLGFDLMVHYGHSAAFLSAGGYHHHIGLNTWAGVGAPPPPPDAVGLRIFDIVLPYRNDLAPIVARLRAATIPYEEHDDDVLTHDPSGNAVRLTLRSKEA